MFILISNVLSVVLFVVIAIIIVKKILIGVNGTDSGIINLVLAFLGVIGLVCSLTIFLGSYSIEGLTAKLNNDKSISAQDISIIKQQITETKNSNIISLIVGYSTLIFDYIVYKIIDKKNKHEHSIIKKRWDYNKLK